MKFQINVDDCNVKLTIFLKLILEVKSCGNEVKSSFIIRHTPTISTELRWLTYVGNFPHFWFSLNPPFLKPSKLIEKTFDNSHKIGIEPLFIHLHIQLCFHSITSLEFVRPKSSGETSGPLPPWKEGGLWWGISVVWALTKNTCVNPHQQPPAAEA